MSVIKHRFRLSGDAGDLGLECKEAGVFLAGVPLLRGGAQAMEPRPIEEVRALMKSAYGADFDGLDLVAGLKVAARALNLGDLARAMTAVLRLRLPPLNWPAAVNLAKAEAALAKYEGQPRDWHGRWATGGEARPESGGDPLIASRAGAQPDRNPFGLVVDPKDGSLWTPGGPGLAHPSPFGPKQPALVPASSAQRQQYLEWLVGAKQNYPAGVMSPEEAAARAQLSAGGRAARPADTPAAQLARYPHAWDSIVERVVAERNRRNGVKPGDPTYLDPDLVKAMIMVESAFNRHAYDTDPMQVNKPGRDWVEDKAALGLKQGVPPGHDLGIQAGVAWLDYKSYHYDDRGRKTSFRGWPNSVTAYNGGGNPHYWADVTAALNLIHSARKYIR
jgi:hypothetical protein